jgi:inosine/guanosine/xanthosine phosphorylase family protein
VSGGGGEPNAAGDEAARSVAQALGRAGLGGAPLAVVLGSGLGAFGAALDAPRELDYGAVPGLPRSSVPGHSGRFLGGRLGGVQILLLSGRVHLYEGFSAAQVTVAVRAAALAGCRVLVLTNAAGGLRPDWPPGTLMRITDHLNLQGRTPLRAEQRGRGCAFDADLGAELDRVAAELGLRLERGVYAALPGPSYETPAEVRALARFGADAVGMSTVLEALAGHAAGLRVVGISCITNLAAGLSTAPLDHGEVIETGRRTAADFGRLLAAALPRLHSSASSACSPLPARPQPG